MSSPKSPSLVRGTSIVSSLTLLSRLLGFVREILVARLFGATVTADAYFVALRIPNLLRSVFAEGALTSAFVPVFSNEIAHGREQSQRALSSITSLLTISTIILSLLGVIFAKSIVSAFAPGFIEGTDRYELCVLLTQIMFPYIISVSIVALLNGALNSVGIFGASAWAQVVMNVVLIIGAYVAGVFEHKTAAIILAWSVVGGGVIQIVTQLPALKRAGLQLRFSIHIFTPPVILVLKLMVPAILGAAVYQLTIFLNTQLASVLEDGSVAWLSYADRLTQLPIGVFTIALASVLLPTLSRAKAVDDHDLFGKTLIDSLRYTSFLMIPLSALLILFASPIISLMFQRGQFDAHATLKTAQAVQMYSFGLWAVSCHSMIIRAFNAQHDTKTPTFIGILTLSSTLILSLIFMGHPAHEDTGTIFHALINFQIFITSLIGGLNLGHAGLALASGLSFYLSFTVSTFITSKRNPTIQWNRFIYATLRALFGVAVGWAFVVIVHLIELQGILQLFGESLAFMLGYITTSLVLKNPEAHETFALLNRLRGSVRKIRS